MHKGEYVIPAWQVDKYPQAVSEIERIRKNGFAVGGSVGMSSRFVPTGQNTNSAMIEELRLLRSEVAEMRAQDRQIGMSLIKSGNRTVDQLQEWNVEGLKTVAI